MRRKGMELVNPEAAAATSLMNAAAVRQRAKRMLALALDGRLPPFRVDLSRLEATADLVAATTRRAYPTLDVPLHARWRHFVHGGTDRWAAIEAATCWRDRHERARAAFDLAIVSVLVDAGAGGTWRYRDAARHEAIGRSEGLALASLAMFAAGALSCDPTSPLRADARALQGLSGSTLARHFQVSSANPLPGMPVRLGLLRRLGATVAAKPEIFARADSARPGGLVDHLAAIARGGSIAAPTILAEVLLHLGSVWPSRLAVGGVPLGDCWRHPAMVGDGPTGRLVPLHKLSQWLTYSLLEPLAAFGISVTDIDGLTGLAEYRNGGLFIDMGVLTLDDAGAAARRHEVGSPVVVAWRALTVALLDRLAEHVRRRLAVDAETFPLAKVLQGGTWAAGRALACERRSDGSPPLKVIADASVF
jgi:hypothetical protein